MKLEAKKVDMEASIPIVIMNLEDAKELGINPMDRIIIEKGNKKEGP